LVHGWAHEVVVFDRRTRTPYFSIVDPILFLGLFLFSMPLPFSDLMMAFEKIMTEGEVIEPYAMGLQQTV